MSALHLMAVVWPWDVGRGVWWAMLTPLKMRTKAAVSPIDAAAISIDMCPPPLVDISAAIFETSLATVRLKE